MTEETEQKIKVKEVRGLETIFDFNHDDEYYKAFIAQRRLIRSYEKEVQGYGGAKSKLSETATNLFNIFIMPYLHQNNLFLGRCMSGNSKTYLRNGNRIEVNCEGIKIIPGRENVLDGYIPELIFRAGKENLSARCSLKREGFWTLKMLEDFFQRLHLNGNGNGIEKPKLKFSQDKQIYVASIEQVPVVLNNMKEIYNRIGEKRFEELAELLRNTRNLERDGGNQVASEVLRQEYEKRLKLLLPTDL